MISLKTFQIAGMFAAIFSNSVMAQDAADPASMLCKDFLALDVAAKMEATTAFRADPMAAQCSAISRMKKR